MGPILGGSNLMQIYDNFLGISLIIVHEVWVANIVTPALCKKQWSFSTTRLSFVVSPRFAADIKNGRTCFLSLNDLEG